METNGLWKDFDMIRQQTVPQVQEQDKDEHLLYKSYCQKLHHTAEVVFRQIHIYASKTL